MNKFSKIIPLIIVVLVGIMAFLMYKNILDNNTFNYNKENIKKLSQRSELKDEDKLIVYNETYPACYCYDKKELCYCKNNDEVKAIYIPEKYHKFSYEGIKINNSFSNITSILGNSEIKKENKENCSLNSLTYQYETYNITFNSSCTKDSQEIVNNILIEFK